MIQDIDGRPIPNQEIVRRVQQIDLYLDLRFIRMPGPEGPQKAWWAVIEHWRPDDSRWSWVQQGKMDKEMAFDMITHLPLDCSVDQAYGFLVANLKKCTDTRSREYLSRCDNYNRKLIKERKEEIVDMAGELAKVNAPTLFGDKGPARVYQTDAKNAPRKRGRPPKVKAG